LWHKTQGEGRRKRYAPGKKICKGAGRPWEREQHEYSSVGKGRKKVVQMGHHPKEWADVEETKRGGCEGRGKRKGGFLRPY